MLSSELSNLIIGITDGNHPATSGPKRSGIMDNMRCMVCFMMAKLLLFILIQGSTHDALASYNLKFRKILYGNLALALQNFLQQCKKKSEILRIHRRKIHRLKNGQNFIIASNNRLNKAITKLFRRF